MIGLQISVKVGSGGKVYGLKGVTKLTHTVSTLSALPREVLPHSPGWSARGMLLPPTGALLRASAIEFALVEIQVQV